MFFFEYFKDALHHLLTCIVSDKNLCLPNHCFLVSRVSFFSDSSKIFPLSLVLSNLTMMMCFGVIFFMFPMLQVHWVTWINGFIVFISFENILGISFQIFFVSPLPFFPFFAFCVPFAFFSCDSNFTNIGWPEVIPWFNDALFIYFLFLLFF